MGFQRGTSAGVRQSVSIVIAFIGRDHGMTTQGKWNLLGIVLLPAAAVLGAALAASNGVLEAYRATYIFLFALNFVITVPAALLSALFLRRSSGNMARWIAILPTLVPVAVGSVWYLWRGLMPASVAPGAEYIGAPQYLLVAVLVVTFFVLVLRVTRIVPRTA
jgi:hypothetical protein